MSDDGKIVDVESMTLYWGPGVCLGLPLWFRSLEWILPAVPWGLRPVRKKPFGFPRAICNLFPGCRNDERTGPYHRFPG